MKKKNLRKIEIVAFIILILLLSLFLGYATAGVGENLTLIDDIEICKTEVEYETKSESKIDFFKENDEATINLEKIEIKKVYEDNFNEFEKEISFETENANTIDSESFLHFTVLENKETINSEIYTPVFFYETNESKSANDVVLGKDTGERNFFVDLSAGFCVPIVMYDSIFSGCFGRAIFPSGAEVKCSGLFSVSKNNFLGASANCSFSYLSSENLIDYYLLSGIFFDGFLDFVWQFTFGGKSDLKKLHKFMFDFHAGPGFFYFDKFLFEFENGVKSEKLNSLNFGLKAGFSIKFFLGNFFAETILDFKSIFVSDMMFGIFVPVVSAGWRF